MENKNENSSNKNFLFHKFLLNFNMAKFTTGLREDEIKDEIKEKENYEK